jgi:hypothetical protein
MKTSSLPVRITCLILGIAGAVLTFLTRSSREAISVGSWKVTFKFFLKFPQHWFTLHLAWFIIVPALLLVVWLMTSSSARSALNTLRANPRSLGQAAVGLGLFLLTLVPLDYVKDLTRVTDQEMWLTLVFGSAAVLFLCIGLGSWLEPAGRALLRVYDYLLGLPAWQFTVGTALFVFVICNLVSWFVFHHIPHIQDTVAQVFQARLFAHGRLFLSSPPYPEFFDSKHVLNNGRWFCQYPPGHPAILTLGVLTGMPWLVNPVMGTLTVVVIYYLGREIYDEPTARLGTLLAAFSPFLVFMSAEFMNHSSALLFAALFMLFFARSVRARGIANPVLAGLCLGVVTDIRPFTALLIALPFALHAGYELYRMRAGASSRYALMIVAAAVVVGLMLLYNWQTTGNPLLFGYVAKYGTGHEIGFGRSGWGEPYTLGQALNRTAIDLYALNRFLFEFPIPSLAFLALFFALSRPERWDYLLLGTLVSLVGGYFFYWWHGILFGPRWEYEALPALVLLSARGIRSVRTVAGERLHLPIVGERIRAATARLFVLCYAGMFILALPPLVRAYSVGFGVLHTTARCVRKANIHNALVFARKYDEVFLHNQLDLNGDIVYAKDLGSLNPILTRQYPDRTCYAVHRDSLRLLPDMDFATSPVKAGLDSASQQLLRWDLRQYQTLLWPVAELRDIIPESLRARLPQVVSYRELTQRLVGDETGFGRYLPALAVWVLDDRSEGLVIFTLFDNQDDFVVGDYRFTKLSKSVNGRVVTYDVRKVNDPRPIPVPVEHRDSVPGEDFRLPH